MGGKILGLFLFIIFFFFSSSFLVSAAVVNRRGGGGGGGGGHGGGGGRSGGGVSGHSGGGGSNGKATGLVAAGVVPLYGTGALNNRNNDNGKRLGHHYSNGGTTNYVGLTLFVFPFLGLSFSLSYLLFLF